MGYGVPAVVSGIDVLDEVLEDGGGAILPPSADIRVRVKALEGLAGKWGPETGYLTGLSGVVLCQVRQLGRIGA
jgi:hypothetical protein